MERASIHQEEPANQSNNTRLMHGHQKDKISPKEVAPADPLLYVDQGGTLTHSFIRYAEARAQVTPAPVTSSVSV